MSLYKITTISIHAPTKGATLGMFDIEHQTIDFNPRSHEGSDYNTHDASNCFSNNFNPRSHEGSDMFVASRTPSALNFNPRSHEGSDTICKRNWYAICYFNPRSHEGSDSCPAYCYVYGTYFNPRSHEGSDRLRLRIKTNISTFQSTLPRRERQLA